VTGIVTVYATFADAEEAARIARILVEERLAACANILGPVQSIYRWQGKVGGKQGSRRLVQDDGRPGGGADGAAGGVARL
jgi:uncharacterized protein involved in tolerance to divalent cations